MQLIQVEDQAGARDFMRANVELMRGIPGYIRPLDKDIDQVFDPKKQGFSPG
jgi:hypothetical protein